MLIYLEDLGPKELLKERGFDLKNFIEEEDEVGQVEDAKLPSEKYQH